MIIRLRLFERQLVLITKVRHEVAKYSPKEFC